MAALGRCVRKIGIREHNRLLILDPFAAALKGAEEAQRFPILDGGICRALCSAFAQLVFGGHRVRVHSLLACDPFQPGQHAAIVVLIRLSPKSSTSNLAWVETVCQSVLFLRETDGGS